MARELSKIIGTGSRNMVTNGDVRIDQRNVGNAVAASPSGVYGPDRFKVHAGTGGFSIQQVTDNVPTGFSHAAKLVVTSAVTPASGSIHALSTTIIGYDASQLNYGKASAAQSVLSFYVNSAVTGKYSISIINSDNLEAYISSYTVMQANTWERKKIVIPGLLSGSQNTDVSAAMEIRFSLGDASDRAGVEGIWNAPSPSVRLKSPDSINWISYSGATILFSGIQLEIGSSASEFLFSNFTEQLDRCRLYYEKSYPLYVAPGSSVIAETDAHSWGGAPSACLVTSRVSFKTVKRATPNIKIWSHVGTFNKIYTEGDGDQAVSISGYSTSGFRIWNPNGLGLYHHAHWSADAEL